MCDSQAKGFVEFKCDSFVEEKERKSKIEINEPWQNFLAVVFMG